MKKLIKKILSFVFNEKREKFILIFLPGLAIVLACLVLIPVIRSIRLPDTSPPPEPTDRNSVYEAKSESTPKPTKKPAKKEEELSDCKLTATSTENDLYIFVRDTEGKPVTGHTFRISVVYPSGNNASYDSQTDGSCYLINLPAGTYRISMEDDSFKTPDPIECVVKDRISYTFIEDVEDIVEIKDVSEGLNEIKTNEAEAPVEAVAEVIDTGSSGSGETVSQPVLDSRGNQTYRYTYEVMNNHLLDSSGNETNIIPMTEYVEGDEILVCGLVYDDGFTYTVDLFNDDNTPKAEYAITATPITIEVSSAYGWQNEGGSVYFLTPEGNKVTGLAKIDGRLYYFNQYGKKASSLGVDVSFYNGYINWNALKNAGVEFAVIRAGFRGYGSGIVYQDSCFLTNIRNAKAAGIKVGVYFYSSAANRVEAVEEASLCKEWLNGMSLDMPIYIDMEYSGTGTGRTDHLSVAQRVEIVQAFCETVKSTGYSAGVYCSEMYLKEALNYSSISQYSIWIASYTNDNQLPSTSYAYNIWQFTDRGRINGVDGDCDINVIF